MNMCLFKKKKIITEKVEEEFNYATPYTREFYKFFLKQKDAEAKNN
jgi:hypothetical protein